MLWTDISINMYQPDSISNGAKKLSFSWKHFALNSLPGNAAWFPGWMAGNQRSSDLGKVKIILICASGRAMFFLYSYVLMFCFYVLMFFLNPGYFWIHYVIPYVLMSLVYTGHLSSLWNLFLALCYVSLTEGVSNRPAVMYLWYSLIFLSSKSTFQQRLSLMVVSTTRCKRNIDYLMYDICIGLYYIDITGFTIKKNRLPQTPSEQSIFLSVECLRFFWRGTHVKCRRVIIVNYTLHHTSMRSIRFNVYYT